MSVDMKELSLGLLRSYRPAAGKLGVCAVNRSEPGRRGKVRGKVRTPMASICITIPELAQATSLFLQERFPALEEKEEIGRAVFYRNQNLGLGFSGKLSGTKSEVSGVGTVTLERHGEVFVYQGRWTGSLLQIEQLLADNLEICHGRLFSSASGKRVCHELCKEKAVVDDSYVRVEDSPLEFALRPMENTVRLPGSDGEYLRADLGDEESHLLRLGVEYVHSMSRTIVGKNSANELVEGFLDVCPEKASIFWYIGGESGLEVPVEVEKFRTWFTGCKDYNGQRNLLRALDVEIPLLRKKSALPSTSLAS